MHFQTSGCSDHVERNTGNVHRNNSVATALLQTADNEQSSRHNSRTEELSANKETPDSRMLRPFAGVVGFYQSQQFMSGCDPVEGSMVGFSAADETAKLCWRSPNRRPSSSQDKFSAIGHSCPFRRRRGSPSPYENCASSEAPQTASSTADARTWWDDDSRLAPLQGRHSAPRIKANGCYACGKTKQRHARRLISRQRRCSANSAWLARGEMA